MTHDALVNYLNYLSLISQNKKKIFCYSLCNYLEFSNDFAKQSCNVLL